MTADGKPIRVRFAPSPTGPFSLGNARTALFNWVFARQKGGEFLLRIEDTDKERSKKEHEEEILNSLKWLNLEWDGEIIRQSERTEIYKNHLSKLLEEGSAYWCFCAEEELELERQARLSNGFPPVYGGRCRTMKKEEAEKRIAAGESATIRFKTPDKKISFTDLIRGKIEFNTTLLGDMIIAKDLDHPLYNFAAAVDDAEMKISHVIRGEDHIPNTPKQILIQQAFGFPSPAFAHLPLILGPDKKKLSKRHLKKSFLDYRNEGYLPEAMINFLALLGWHPIRDREVFTMDELVNEFNFEKVQKSGAVFNEEKLNWLNAYHLKSIEPERIMTYLNRFLPESWFKNPTFLIKVIKAERERVKILADFKNLASFFFELPAYEAKLLIWKNAPLSSILENLESVLEIIEAIPDGKFTEKDLEPKIMELAEKRGRGEVLWPLRVSLSGQKASPGPIEIMDVLGKKETARRIKLAIEKLSR